MISLLNEILTFMKIYENHVFCHYYVKQNNRTYTCYSCKILELCIWLKGKMHNLHYPAIYYSDISLIHIKSQIPKSRHLFHHHYSALSIIKKTHQKTMRGSPASDCWWHQSHECSLCAPLLFSFVVLPQDTVQTWSGVPWHHSP